MSEGWYELVQGADLQQGDILIQCPVCWPVMYFDPNESTHVTFKSATYDVVILSQTCDLVAGREKVQLVVVSPLAAWSEIESHDRHWLKNRGELKKASKHELPAFFVLPEYKADDFVRELSVVHFRQIYTLPVEFLREHAHRNGKRLRLQSPYREQLSQHFGAFFQRVAVPAPVRI